MVTGTLLFLELLRKCTFYKGVGPVSQSVNQQGFIEVRHSAWLCGVKGVNRSSVISKSSSSRTVS